jgi:aldose sugar dehydrogenase
MVMETSMKPHWIVPTRVPAVNFASVRAVGLGILMSAILVSPAAAQRFSTDLVEIDVEAVASGLEHPWGMAFLPDGELLITERPGRLRVLLPDGGLSQPISGVPAVADAGQGGLLDVTIDPDYANNRLVYFSFAESRDGGSALSVARGRLDLAQNALSDVEVIFRQQPAVGGGRHFGSRVVFANDGTLFVTAGDRGDHSDQSQNPENHIGAVMRINSDGSIPQDNPGVGRDDWADEVWSIGHRNIQGATMRPGTDQFWTNEHGARGGDEVNLIAPGLNYGWPVISYGVHYSGAPIGEGTARPGMEQPVYYWDPSIAPSGMAFYTGDAFPEWQGNVLIGGLVGQLLSRLTMRGDAVVDEERMLQGLNARIRAVSQGPDGLVYLLTDAADGSVLRLSPAGSR